MSKDYSSLPENELLAMARAGNEEAFTALVRQNSPMIYKISRRVLKNHEDAEDTTQNVLIKAYQRLDSFDGHSRFSTWLFRVAFNEALMTIRRNRSRRQDCVVDLSVVDSGGARAVSDFQDSQRKQRAKLCEPRPCGEGHAPFNASSARGFLASQTRRLDAQGNGGRIGNLRRNGEVASVSRAPAIARRDAIPDIAPT